MADLWACGLQLRVVEGPNKGRTFPLDSPDMTIGRAKNEGDRAPGWVLLFDPAVSRVHADLLWDPKLERYVLKSKSDTNPVVVNGKPVMEAFLDAGDQIIVGQSQLDLQQADFRFGGSRPPSARHINTSLNMDPAVVQGARLNDGEKLQSTKKASRKVALSVRPKLKLVGLAGPRQGKEIPITGNSLGVGGSLAPVTAPDSSEHNPTPDQHIDLGLENVHADALVLTWRELEHAWRIRVFDYSFPIEVERDIDGIHWAGKIIPHSQAEILIRHGDILWLDHSAFTILEDENGSEE